MLQNINLQTFVLLPTYVAFKIKRIIFAFVRCATTFV